jgi:ankyrin repeat protein
MVERDRNYLARLEREDLEAAIKASTSSSTSSSSSSSSSTPSASSSFSSSSSSSSSTAPTSASSSSFQSPSAGIAATNQAYLAPLPADEEEIFPNQALPSNVSIPEQLRCSITQLIMVDPVIAADNQTYEREAIEEWLENHNTSPLTNVQLANKNLNENLFARSFIDGFLTSNPQLKGSDEVYLPKAKLRALREAIGKHDLYTVKSLVTADHRVLARYLATGRTALHAACEIGTSDILAYFLSQLTPEQLDKILALPKPNNWQPSVLNQTLLTAASQGDTKTMEQSFRLGANLEAKDIEGKTPLGKACESGQLAVVDLLLQRGANYSARDNNNNAPLDLAVLHGHGAVVNLLLDRKGLPDYQPTSPSDLKQFCYMTLKLTHDQLKKMRTEHAQSSTTTTSSASTTAASSSSFFATSPASVGSASSSSSSSTQTRPQSLGTNGK